MQLRNRVALVVLLTTLTGIARAGVIVNPTSYDAPNGFSGSFNYWDESYNGSGNTMVDGASLTGGLGDLTDGVVASDNWNVVEAPAGPGPYVGWTINPTLTFHFASALDFETVRIHFDDSNGSGGVSAPQGVVINGMNFPVADPSGSAPFFADFDITGLTSNQLTIQLIRRNTWVFSSEFLFTAAAPAVIPEPSSLAMSFLGLLGLLAIARPRIRKSIDVCARPGYRNESPVV